MASQSIYLVLLCFQLLLCDFGLLIEFRGQQHDCIEGSIGKGAGSWAGSKDLGGGDFSWNGPEVEADRWIMASRLAFRRSCGLTVVSYGLLQKMKRLRRKFTGIPCKNFRLTARFISSFAADGLAVRNVYMRLVINSSSLSSIF